MIAIITGTRFDFDEIPQSHLCPKSNNKFVMGQNPMTPSPICSSVSPHNAFPVGRSKHRISEACGPSMAVNSLDCRQSVSRATIC